MKAYKSESNVLPNEWDIGVSTVYHNFNVEQKEKEGEETSFIYVYDVEEFTLQEYSNRQQQSINDLENAVIELAELIGG